MRGASLLLERGTGMASGASSQHGRGVTVAWNWCFVLVNTLCFVLVGKLFLVDGVTAHSVEDQEHC